MDRTDPSKYIVINKNSFKEAFTEIIFYDLLYIFDKKLAILAFVTLIIVLIGSLQNGLQF